MRISYMVSTMVFWWRENRLSFEQECQYLKSLGFGVELWPNINGLDECRYDKRNWDRLAAATEGMMVSMRSRNDNPTIEHWEEQIRCASLLGANIVADCQSLGIPEDCPDPGMDYATRIVELADKHAVRLCLETGALSTLRQIGERFDSLSYCLDTGRSNLDGVFSFKQYVDELAGRIEHLHLNDNYGRIDDHEPPGLHGGIAREDWDYLLRVLKKQGRDVTASFEMSPSMPAVMIHQATDFVFERLKWPGRPRRITCAEATYHPR